MEHVKVLRREIEEHQRRAVEFEKFNEILAYFLVKMENFFDPEDYKPLRSFIPMEELKEKLIKLESCVTNNARQAINSAKLSELEAENRELRDKIADLTEYREARPDARVDTVTAQSHNTSYYDQESKRNSYEGLAERIRMVEEHMREQSNQFSEPLTVKTEKTRTEKSRTEKSKASKKRKPTTESGKSKKSKSSIKRNPLKTK